MKMTKHPFPAAHWLPEVRSSLNPGKREISRDKYLGTDCFLEEKQENNL
jgi:hypothetical protein